jgi:hypothetical protein
MELRFSLRARDQGLQLLRSDAYLTPTSCGLIGHGLSMAGGIKNPNSMGFLARVKMAFLLFGAN